MFVYIFALNILIRFIFHNFILTRMMCRYSYLHVGAPPVFIRSNSSRLICY